MLKKIVIKRSIVIFGGYFSLTLKCVAFLFCLAIISESSGLVFSTVPASYLPITCTCANGPEWLVMPLLLFSWEKKGVILTIRLNILCCRLPFSELFSMFKLGAT